jgi:hypothetical protein
MDDGKVTFQLKISEDGNLKPDIDLSEFGINEGDKIVLQIDEETGKAEIKLLHIAAIDSIMEFDDKIFAIYSSYMEQAAHQVTKSKFPNTNFVLFNLNASINSIKESIYNLTSSQDIYSIKALYRLLLEHFLKIYYIFKKATSDKNDNIGTDYLEFVKISELISYGKSIYDVYKILEFEFQNKGVYELLCEFRPEYRKYSKAHVERKVSQFRYKNMISYICKEHQTHSDEIDMSILLSIIPEYSELSSYVHGGLSASHETTALYKKNEMGVECARFAKAAYNLATIVKIFTTNFFVFSIDKSYLRGAKEIKKIWKDSSEEVEGYFKKESTT